MIVRDDASNKKIQYNSNIVAFDPISNKVRKWNVSQAIKEAKYIQQKLDNLNKIKPLNNSNTTFVKY